MSTALTNSTRPKSVVIVAIEAVVREIPPVTVGNIVLLQGFTSEILCTLPYHHSGDFRNQKPFESIQHVPDYIIRKPRWQFYLREISMSATNCETSGLFCQEGQKLPADWAA